MPLYYKNELADVHDRLFGSHANHAARWIIKLIKKDAANLKRLVDLGCGSGISTDLFGKAGFEVTGVDSSPSMIRIARRRNPRTKFLRQSVYSAKLPHGDVFVGIGETFNYLNRNTPNKDTLYRFFKKVHNVLPPKGLFVFDMAGPGQVKKPYVENRLLHDSNRVIFMKKEESPRFKTLKRHVIIFDKLNKSYRRSDETHLQRLFPKSEIHKLLRKLDFQVSITAGYGKYRLTGNRYVVVAKKK